MSDRLAVGLTIWGEARGEPIEGQIAVGCVIRNRLPHAIERWRATEATYRGVCLAPDQFSCWTGVGHNAASVGEMLGRELDGHPVPPTLDQALWIADGLIGGALLDLTNGATAYYAPLAMVPPGSVPRWSVGHAYRTIGSQRFLCI